MQTGLMISDNRITGLSHFFQFCSSDLDRTHYITKIEYKKFRTKKFVEAIQELHGKGDLRKTKRVIEK